MKHGKTAVAHLILAAIMTLFLATATTAATEREPPPNVLFILVDDLGWTDAGFMGSRYYETPNIDRLAGEGMVFDNAYTCGPNCAPTRACLMSGQYPPRHGVYTSGKSARGRARNRRLVPVENNQVLDPKIVTIAESLAAAGYKTALVGKWHLGPDPETQGFHENVGGTEDGRPPGGYFSPYKNPKLIDGPKGEYLTDRLTAEAVRFLDDNRDRPFFLFLSYYAVHWPLQPKVALKKKYEGKSGDEFHNKPDYAAMIDSVDQGVGRVLRRLDELELRRSTIVIFHSDNGGQRGATSMHPLRGSKGTLYEGGVRVPLVIRWPGKVKPGSHCEVPVHSVDFYPTLLDATPASAPEAQPLDGESLMPLLDQTGGLGRNAIYWHFPAYLQTWRRPDNPWRTTPAGAVRAGNYKLLEFFEDDRVELYDLQKDVGEQNDLAGSLPDKTLQLRKLLQKWRASIGAAMPQPKKASP